MIKSLLINKKFYLKRLLHKILCAIGIHRVIKYGDTAFAVDVGNIKAGSWFEQYECSYCRKERKIVWHLC
jgi:hypothetical protein